MNNEELIDIDIPEGEIIIKNISLRTLNSSGDDTSLQHDGEMKHNVISKASVKPLLNAVECLQKLLIVYQKKFTEYEGVSEYASCGRIDIHEHQKFQSLPPSLLESQLVKLQDNFGQTFEKIYETIRSMDIAVVRLREETSKMGNQSKLSKLKENSGRDLSIVQKYPTISDDRITESYSNKQSPEKRLKKLETKVKEQKNLIDELKNDCTELECMNGSLKKENQRLKKETKDLEETSRSEMMDEIISLRKEIKKLCKYITSKDLNESDTRTENPVLKNLDEKVDLLISFAKQNEATNEYNVEKIIEEIGMVQNEMKEFKGKSDRSHDDRVEIEKLRSMVDSLKQRLGLKEKELHDQKFSYLHLEKEMSEKIQQLTLAQKRQEEWIDQELSNVICKCKQPVTQPTEPEFENREKAVASETIINKYSADNQTLKNENDDLKLQCENLRRQCGELESGIKKLKDETEKKNRALEVMKEKIKKLSNSGNSPEEVDKMKRQFDQANIEIKKLKEKIQVLNLEHKTKFDECENLKKDKIRLESEIINMRKLNFQKQVEGK